MDTNFIRRKHDGQHNPDFTVTNEKRPIPTQVEDVCHDDQKNMYSRGLTDVLKELNLNERYKNKIQFNEALAIPMTAKDDNVAFALLRKILLVNCEALIDISPETSDLTVGTRRSLKDIKASKKMQTKGRLSPHDILIAAYQCCEPLLRQLLAKKMYLCKFALPFIITKSKCNILIDNLPLRNVCLYEEGAATGKGHVLDIATNVITIARLGRPTFSKSQLLNTLMSGQASVKSIYFDKTCKGGSLPRKLNKGLTEIFWLPKQKDRDKNIFENVVTFLNARGSLEAHSLHLYKHISDCIVIVVEASELGTYKSLIELALEKFTFVILIYSGRVHDITDDVLESLSDIPFLCTENNGMENNMLDLIVELVKELKQMISNVELKSLDQRLRSLSEEHVLLTENDHVLRNSYQQAAAVFEKMKKDCNSNRSLREMLTPVSSTGSNVANLVEDLAKPCVTKVNEEKHVELNKFREQRLGMITESIIFFVNTLAKHKEMSAYIVRYLQTLIEKKITDQMPQLNSQTAASEKEACETEINRKTESHKTTTTIKDGENSPQCLQFSIDYMFREIGHIYDTAIELNVNVEDLGIPSVQEAAVVMAKLIVSGISFELIDGDNKYLAKEWVHHVFKALSDLLQMPNVGVVSVLGIQSSGKSTLMNCMFGLDLHTSSGRCTRGAYVRLLPVQNDIRDPSMFSYVLLVDSEGLRAPELANENNSKRRDNQLATFITGIAHVSLLNNMGESFMETKDILEIVVHAFLRLKLANNALCLGQTCMFLHQNVTDEWAAENMRDGFKNLLEMLDSVTKECANAEGIQDIKQFNDIINFDIRSGVFTISNLWQGYAPMKTISKSYTETLLKIKKEILMSLRDFNKKSHVINLIDFAQKVSDVWRGVLSEDFIFSFRNNLELKAYCSLEIEIERLKWQLESYSRAAVKDTFRLHFGDCKDINSLKRAESKAVQTVTSLVQQKGQEIHRQVESLFETSQYKEIVIQWKAFQMKSLEVRLDELLLEIKLEAKKRTNQLTMEFRTAATSKTDREQIREKSFQIARNIRDGLGSQNDNETIFEREIWKDYRDQMLSKHSEKIEINITYLFKDILSQVFRKHIGILKEELEAVAIDVHLPHVQKLQDTWKSLAIDKETCKGRCARVKGIFKEIFHTINYPAADAFVKSFLEEVNESILQTLEDDRQINYSDVQCFVATVESLYLQLKTNLDRVNISVSQYYHVKCVVHACRYCCRLFLQHNIKFQQRHGVEKHLNAFKKILKCEFMAAVEGRQEEEQIAEIFSDAFLKLINDRLSEDLPSKLVDSIRVKLPCTIKSELIKQMLAEMARSGTFDDYTQYIRSPERYASQWLTKKAVKILFSESLYSETLKSCVDDLHTDIKKAITKTGHELQSNDTIVSVEQWYTILKSNVPNGFLHDTYFRYINMQVVLKESSFFVECLLEQTARLVKELKTETGNGSENKGIGQKVVAFFQRNLVPFLWGCKEVCPFCGEPCVKANNHDGSDHVCKQHRPECCTGTRLKSTQEAAKEVCNFSVQSNATYTCGVIKTVCKCPSERNHPYREYKQYFPAWDITPSSDMYETASFWMRFIAKHRNELVQFYRYELDVPEGWRNVSEQEAIKSLEKYN